MPWLRLRRVVALVLLAGTVALATALPASTTRAMHDGPSVRFNGRPLPELLAPIEVRGVTLAPIQALATAAGGTYQYDAARGRLILRRRDHTVRLDIGSPAAWVDGRFQVLPGGVSPVSLWTEVLVPFPFLPRALGLAPAPTPTGVVDPLNWVDSDFPPRGGSLRLALPDPFTRRVNPLAVGDGGDAVLADLLFSRLFAVDNRGIYRSDLAADWLVEGDLVTVTLQRSARWHDGQPVTAADVQATYDGARALGRAAAVARVEALDDHTVRFLMPGYRGNPLADLDLRIVPAHVTDARVGSGPFKWAETVATSTATATASATIELAANPDYYRGAPYLDRLQLRPADVFTALSEIQVGGLDVLDVTAGGAGLLQERPGVQLVSQVSDELVALEFTGPLAVPGLAGWRRQVAAAIDRSALAGSVGSLGTATLLRPPALTALTALTAATPAPPSDTVPGPAPTTAVGLTAPVPSPLPVAYPTGDTDLGRLAAALVDQWRQAGIPATAMPDDGNAGSGPLGGTARLVRLPWLDHPGATAAVPTLAAPAPPYPQNGAELDLWHRRWEDSVLQEGTVVPLVTRPRVLAVRQRVQGATGPGGPWWRQIWQWWLT